MILILERVPTSLRGELSRWFLEPKAGVFVGRVSAVVRDLLWDKSCGQAKYGGCVLIYSSDTEQGYRIRTHGKTARIPEDFEGLSLIRIPN